MPIIDFCFSGWVRGASVEKAVNKHGKEIDVSHMPSEKLCEKLREGSLYISLSDCLGDSHKAEINLFDYEPK